MQGGKRRLGGARSQRAARLALATVLAGGIATVVVAFAPSSRSSRAEARPSVTTRAPASTSTTIVRTTPARVVVFGDSLTAQAADALSGLGRAHGLSVSVEAFAGLAPCDDTELIRRTIESRPDAIVLAFSGNNLTPCMHSFGHPLGGTAYDDKYHHDIGDLVAFAARYHVPVEVVAPPAFPPELDIPPRAPLIAQYARIVFDHPDATFVQAAAALGGPAYVTTQACLPGETAALGCQDGRIVVRNASRIHFDDPHFVACPTAGDRCTYSAGAHRYATAVIGGLARIAGLGYRPAPATAAIPTDDTLNSAG
jgi:hypothetical protein